MSPEELPEISDHGRNKMMSAVPSLSSRGEKNPIWERDRWEMRGKDTYPSNGAPQWRNDKVCRSGMAGCP